MAQGFVDDALSSPGRAGNQLCPQHSEAPALLVWKRHWLAQDAPPSPPRLDRQTLANRDRNPGEADPVVSQCSHSLGAAAPSNP